MPPLLRVGRRLEPASGRDRRRAETRARPAPLRSRSQRPLRTAAQMPRFVVVAVTQQNRARRSSSIPGRGHLGHGFCARMPSLPWSCRPRSRPRTILDQAPRRLQPSPQLVVYPAVSFGVELRWRAHDPPEYDQGSRIDRGLLDPISHLENPSPLIQERTTLRPARRRERARSKIPRGRAGGSVGESQAPTQSAR